MNPTPHTPPTDPSLGKLPLRMAGALSALVFVMNGCIEVLYFRGLQSGHLVLLVSVQVCLAAWALAESKVARLPVNTVPLRRLRALLTAQLAMECARGIFLISLPRAGTGEGSALQLLDSGVALVFLPLYFITFLSINQSLMNLYSSNEKRAHDKLHLAELDQMRLALAADARLAAFKAQLEDAIGTMSQGVVMVDADGRIVLFNSQVSRILELPDGVLTEHQPFAQVLEFQTQRGDAHLDRRDLEGSSTQTEAGTHAEVGHLLKTQAGRHVEINSRHLSTGHTVHTYADVSGYVLANAQLRAAMNSLALTQDQLSAEMQRARDDSGMKLRFVASVTHEIRTPLNGIVGMVDLLARSGLTEQQADLIADVQTSTHQLRQLTNDILDLSGLKDARFSLARAPFDLSTCVDKVVRAAQGAAQARGLRLDLFMPDGPCPVVGDVQRLQQILNNLLYNAIKFTDQGWVRVHVEWRQAKAAGGNLEVIISVADSGRGMAPGALNRIFEPFRQADDSISRDFGGTGLGLTLCRELSQAMDGSIRVTSELGQGSEFTVMVMLQRAADDKVGTEAPTAARDDSAVTLEGRRVLVVDDNRINRKLLSLWLSEEGAAVHIAADGAEGLRAATTEPFDVILMDVSMPVMNGVDATRAIRLLAVSPDDQQRRRAVVPIIGVTALAGPQDRQRCLEAGMDAHLSKPLSRGTLLRALAHTIDTQAWRSDVNASATS